MSACERCWSDAHRDPYLDVPDEYKRLVDERKGDKACTAEQQAGPDAGECPECAGRRVLHQHTGECMISPHHGEYGEEIRDRQYKAAKAQGAAEATAAIVKWLRFRQRALEVGARAIPLGRAISGGALDGVPAFDFTMSLARNLKDTTDSIERGDHITKESNDE